MILSAYRDNDGYDVDDDDDGDGCIGVEDDGDDEDDDANSLGKPVDSTNHSFRQPISCSFVTYRTANKKPDFPTFWQCDACSVDCIVN